MKQSKMANTAINELKESKTEFEFRLMQLICSKAINE